MPRHATSLPSSQLLNEAFELMYEAQDQFRTENYRKQERIFEEDWGKCDEKYRFPKCCMWEDKKKFARTTSDCWFLKGDVILETDQDALDFQTFVDVVAIQGALVLRNTSLLSFSLPNLRRIGFGGGTNPSKIPASLTLHNNSRLRTVRFTRMQQIVKHSTQKYGEFIGNEQLEKYPDGRQYHAFRLSAPDAETDFEIFRPKKVRYVRHLFLELYPYFLFATLVIGVFVYHFIMLEVNEYRVKKKEAEVIDCLVKMRDSTLVSELLLQTPSDVVLSFEDDEMLKLCTDQVELVTTIKRLLEKNLKAFRDQSLEEVSARGIGIEAQN